MREYCLIADMIPMGMASVQVKNIVRRPKVIVSGKRSLIRSFTDCRKKRELPKSHLTNPLIHLQYCTYMGWSRPYCSMRALASSDRTSSPSSCIDRTQSSTKLPGGACMMPKIITDIKNNIGGKIKKRLKMNLDKLAYSPTVLTRCS